jgi:hypothetical protein
MGLFEVNQELTREERKKAWFNGIQACAAQLQETIESMHKVMLGDVWNNGEFTAQEYFDLLGTNGVKSLQVSGALQNISAFVNPDYVPFVVPNQLSYSEDGIVIVGDVPITSEVPTEKE